MVIILDKPISLGDISSDTYPHCFVTNFYVNGPAVMVQVSYEFGTMQQPSADNPSGWNPCPAFLNKQFSLSRDQLVPFFEETVESGANMWDSVEKAIYEQIQAVDPRTAGTLGLGYEPANTTSSGSSTSSGSTASVGTDSSGSGSSPSTTSSTTSSTASAPTASTASNNTSATPAAS